MSFLLAMLMWCWDPAPGATHYQVWYTTDPTFMSPWESQPLVSTTCDQGHPLPAGDLVFFQVKAYNCRVRPCLEGH